MENLYKKIDDVLKRDPKRVATICNSLFSSVIAGEIVYFLNSSFIFIIVLSAFLIIVGFIAINLIIASIKSKKEKKQQIINYFICVTMGLLAGTYIFLTFASNMNIIVTTLGLLIIFLIIVLFINKKRK